MTEYHGHDGTDQACVGPRIDWPTQPLGVIGVGIGPGLLRDLAAGL